MSLRLLGGYAKNFEIKSRNIKGVRPTLSQLKRKIFDRFQNFDEFRFFDLCAGTGSIGFEALSRGCPDVSFLELSKKNCSNLQLNLKRFEETFRSEHTFKARVIQSNFKSVVDYLSESSFTDVFYFDPPFDKPELFEEFFKVAPNMKGMIFIEGDKNKTLREENIIERFSQVGAEHLKTYTSGDHFIALFDN